MDVRPDQLLDTAAAAFAAGGVEALRPYLHPYLHWTDGDGVTTRGRTNVLALLEGGSRLDPPAEHELRDGQIYRWRV